MKSLVLLIPALLAAAPVQTADWSAAGKAYEGGKSSGLSPVTTGEKAMCAGYWMAWYKVAITLSAADQRRLPAPLRAVGAKQASAQWAGQVAPERMRDSTASEKEATAKIEAAAKGDAAAGAPVFEMLGICHV